jgi:hypothetical protein
VRPPSGEACVKVQNPRLLLLSPSDDSEFVQLANRLATEHLTQAAMELALREYYPDAVVRSRGLDGEQDAWYVYRDGHWVPPVR